MLLRFVFVTGGAFTERAADFLRQVENPCISKPFREGELDRLIREGAAKLAGPGVST